MNDDLIKMAQKAHKELVTEDYPGHLGQLDPWTMRLLERFAALVREDEREKIALAHKIRPRGKSVYHELLDEREKQQEPVVNAAAIRSRSKK